MKKEGSMDGTKIRSPEGLTRCGTCRRHVVAGERPSTTRCPFCGVHAARSFRGSAIAGALVMAACSGGEPELEPPPTGPVAVETQTEAVPTAPAPEPEVEPPPPTPEPAVEPEEPVVEANVAPAEEEAERPPRPEPAPVEPEPEPEADEFAEEAPPMRPVARYGLAPMDSFREGSPMVRAPRYGRAPMPRKD